MARLGQITIDMNEEVQKYDGKDFFLPNNVIVLEKYENFKT